MNNTPLKVMLKSEHEQKVISFFIGIIVVLLVLRYFNILYF